MPLNLRIGILVVGSLDWESKSYGGHFVGKPDQVRMKWRETRLKADKRSIQYVRVPIRYGRRSSSRGNTYTMVFSPELGPRLGIGKIFRCRNPANGIDDLVQEAKELWRAEQPNGNDVISAGWGCVAILTSPGFLDHEDAADRTKLLEDWAAFTEKQSRYADFAFSAADRAAAGDRPVIENGRLNIPWPNFRNNWPLSLDVVLLTATKPKIMLKGAYCTAQEIADAWKKNKKEDYYFRNNLLAGIRTADDEEIKTYLDG
ncbi:MULTISPECIES: hypothetical protein [unclassified Mesorhizobium]|uniref:hypothetical protein n=1 Tax=unclassified Mesorhizobium TaxID=325217 RepID=UPI001128F3FC|nr:MULTISPECIES: hypothetical protein [unclassified Mesorhizobium]TPJ39737.1 hypothetical protein FJ437_28080 [Mesorhizobium sp. B2-6-6]MCA0008825.1 hypothetical protein [Mesorhizobium sp. B264B1B]MCA0021924.1 hypothetical protein [Mesorhizobium sp. B264B1A]MCA0026374.1 hypothetical protein [Mesorhizobium sp. B263B1A]MCA0056778.1 hypothetical protein [Mesorhizobium sp. B261B1A]